MGEGVAFKFKVVVILPVTGELILILNPLYMHLAFVTHGVEILVHIDLKASFTLNEPWFY